MQRSSFAMLERFIQAVQSDDPGLEEPAATRERLRSSFAPGATRRMTQLGMLVGAAVAPLGPGEDDAVIYATGYGETRALESYLESFPFPSPTLFQTSIHPGGVQQGLIGRQRSVREVFPISGSRYLAAHGLLAAMLAPAARVIFCGGEERGTWLLAEGVASERAFAFALALARDDAPGSLGRIALVQDESASAEAAMALASFFDLVHHRIPFRGPVAPGLSLEMIWA